MGDKFSPDTEFLRGLKTIGPNDSPEPPPSPDSRMRVAAAERLGGYANIASWTALLFMWAGVPGFFGGTILAILAIVCSRHADYVLEWSSANWAIRRAWIVLVLNALRLAASIVWSTAHHPS